jgi:peptidoglycan hydrolase-like protein with peptidoglycan-binding domain
VPSSADLTTGDLTQSVQQHLKALGYDPGNTDGDLSTDTVIAISQFQAEKGLQVTGEVTPQLLGILGAEVDARQ